MSKYHSLSDRLRRQPGDEYGASFAELEAVLGFPLPKGARSGRNWWTNDLRKPHSRAWAAHGWKVGDIDHAAERVVFRRAASSGGALTPARSRALTASEASQAGRRLKPNVGLMAAVAGGAALAAGLAVLVGRAVLTPKKQPPFPPMRRWKR
jgi:hypothetical protein